MANRKAYTITGTTDSSEEATKRGHKPYPFTLDSTRNTVPPVITLVSPTNGTTIDKDDVVTIEISTPQGTLVSVAIEATYSEGIEWKELVTEISGFSDNFSGASNVRTPISGGFRYAFLRDGDWPSDALAIRVIITDNGANLVTADYSWTVNTTVQQAYRYLMRAFNTVPSNNYMYWLVDDAPDTTAAQSPHPASASDVVVVGVFCKRDTL
jgi:hypothetical protein